jgi:AraC-like DNA-binding protein
MISLRCKMVVRSELDKLGLVYSAIDLGEVNLLEDITQDQQEQLNTNLRIYGLELLGNKKGMLVAKIKSVIIEMVHYADELPALKYSAYISEKLKLDYTYLSDIFSEVQGITIHRFLIIQKIEKAKELLLYDDLSITEIAYKLHYSSVAHLSNQFKNVTGLSPSYFKAIQQKRSNKAEC